MSDIVGAGDRSQVERGKANEVETGYRPADGIH